MLHKVDRLKWLEEELKRAPRQKFSDAYPQDGVVVIFTKKVKEITTEKILELIDKYMDSHCESPTTLIVEKGGYDKLVQDQIRLMPYTNNGDYEQMISINGYTLRVIFATNLSDGEVIVI